MTTTMRTSLLTLATAGALLISAPAWSLNLIGGGSGSPFNPYASTGPHTTIEEAAGSDCTVYRPAELTTGHPVILWGNGTGTGPGTYQGGLNHWASWGYVVVAANTQNAGSGEEMLGCLDYVTDSTMASQLNLNRVGTSGHSQGGGGSLMSGRDSRITATAPMQPYIQGLGHDQSSLDQQSGTMLLLSGSTDFLAGPTSNQLPVFERTNVPVFWANSQGTSHFAPIGNFGVYRGMSTAWWEFQLRGDSDAADLFTGPCLGCDINGWVIRTRGL